jgi:hypothetical protein
MPVPPYLVSVNLLVCERVLLEADNVPSAIRIVDIFYVPEKPANMPDDAVQLVQAYVMAVIRAVQGHRDQHKIRLRMINTVGEVSTLAEFHPTFESKAGLEATPPSVNMVAQLNLAVKRFGTSFIVLDIDNEEVARVPITLLQKPSELKVY